MPFQVSGYFRAYVDNGFHETYQIRCDVPLPEDQIINIMQDVYLKERIPDSLTWHEEIKQGNLHYNDWCYYNSGFYKFESKGNGVYEFTHVTPDLKPEAWQSDENRHQE